ncbi:MAG: lipid A deacylase LpxR family protein, partial [Gammaproteobacteria bacterium]|nr:lipid A deacylase LpxR family protein [Gammaproteobacteria bacterium]
NEIVFNIMYERRTPFHSGQFDSGINYQWIGIQKAELGTIITGADASLALLFTGHGADQTDNIKCSVTQNTYLIRSDRYQGFYALLGATARLTLRNIFLDGNTYRDSPSVEKELLNAGVFYGIGYVTPKWNISANWIRESDRFKTQKEGLNYGSVSFTYRY